MGVVDIDVGIDAHDAHDGDADSDDHEGVVGCVVTAKGVVTAATVAVATSAASPCAQ